MKPISAIIFDLGGVIINPAFASFSAEIEALYDIPASRVEAIVRKHWPPFLLGEIKEKEYWRRFSRDLKIKNKPKRFREIMTSFYHLKSDVVKLIKCLGKNYKMILLSNMSKEWMEYTKEKYPLNELFDSIFTSYELRSAKPYSATTEDDTKIYRAMLEISELKTDECVIIDDHEENLEPAKKLGIKTILFKDAAQLNRELKKLGITNCF